MTADRGIEQDGNAVNEPLTTLQTLSFLSAAALALKIGDFARPTSAADLVKMIRDEAVNHPEVVNNFGGKDAFEKNLQNIEKLDTRFQSTGGVFFKLGSSAAETAQNFADTQLKWRETGGRPSIVGEVAHYLDEIGLNRNDPLYKANLLVAARAEIEAATGSPGYHNQNHFLDVNAQTIEFLKKNNELAAQGVPGAVRLTTQELAEGLLSANRHDVGHPGGKNITVEEVAAGQKVASDPFRLEQRSVDITEPLLKAAGLDEAATKRSNVAVLTTSPDMNGPGKLLKEIDRLHNEGRPIEWEKLPDHEKFPQLELLAADPQARVISQNLRASDTGESSLYGAEANRRATVDLDREWQGYQKAGDATAKLLNPDGETVKPGARWGFLEFVTGGKKGPDAPAVQAAVGENYQALYKQSVEDLEKFKKDNAQKPAPQSAPEVTTKTTTPAANMGKRMSAQEPVPSLSEVVAKTPPAAAETRATVPGELKEAGVAGMTRGAALGAAGVGMALSVPALVEAVGDGDKAAIAVNALNVTASLAGLVPSAAKFVPGLNVGATLGSIALEATKEDTTEHKVERAAEETILAGAGLGIGAAAGAAVTGTGAAAAVAPVVLPAAVVIVAKMDADRIIDTHRTYERNDPG